MLSSLAHGMTRSFEAVGDSVSEALFEPVIRLGVTGLARAGKTVFITSLVANLLDRGRMPQLAAQSEARILAAYLQPQPDDTVPRFDYETHMAALTNPTPAWPSSTRTISELRLSLRVRPEGMLAGLSGPRTVHLDIVDYPGEWLLDLALLPLSYTEWSEKTLARLARLPELESAATYLRAAHAAAGAQSWQEPDVKGLADQFTRYLNAARLLGMSGLTPGRFILPGDLAGSPVVTFAPLPSEERPARRGLWREMERRYEAYCAQVVKPFFREHFARLDRQIVLVDALGAIHHGPQAIDNLRETMAEILSAFRPGRNSILSRLLLGKRVEKILFAATRADHLHHKQHPQLTAIMEALTRDARERARFAGAATEAMSLASIRATTEAEIPHQNALLPCVQGTLLDTGKSAALYPGLLPDDPTQLLAPARSGATNWLDGNYNVMRFAPAPFSRQPGEGPPHIRLDRAAQFLIGDRL